MTSCFKCGQSLTTIAPDGHETTVVALYAIVQNLIARPNVREQLGKYNPPDDVDKVEFSFCYECCLDVLMGVK